MNLIKNLKWRYATKVYDPTKKVSDEAVNAVKEAIQLSASSYGLQLYKVLIIEDQSIREKLKAASWGQSQITDSSHLFVFCHYTEIQAAHVEGYMELIAATQELNPESLTGYANFIKGKLAEKSSLELQHWMAKQTYIALANLLSACAELKIDASPMEGFDADQYSQILGLAEKGLTASMIAPIGYRSADDAKQFNKKVRKPMEELFEVIQPKKKAAYAAIAI